MAGNNRPSHRAYSVRDRDDEDSFWTRIGSCFAHKDRQGYNIVLDALPIDGRIVLREIVDDDDEPETKEKTTRSKKKRAA